MTPDQLAQKVGTCLSEIDSKVMDLLGMELVEIASGRCVAQMTVRDDMVNSQLYCQGGLIFSLADHAFAYASMSDNQARVTLSANIIFTHPAKLGDRLTATAEVSHATGGRTGSCAVVVANQDGQTIAQVQGVSYKTRNQIIPE